MRVSGEAGNKVLTVGGGSVLGRDWLDRWSAMPHLDPVDAAEFAASIDEFREEQESPKSPWD